MLEIADFIESLKQINNAIEGRSEQYQKNMFYLLASLMPDNLKELLENMNNTVNEQEGD